jgi:hypothetical protein
MKIERRKLPFHGKIEETQFTILINAWCGVGLS